MIKARTHHILTGEILWSEDRLEGGGDGVEEQLGLAVGRPLLAAGAAAIQRRLDAHQPAVHHLLHRTRLLVEDIRQALDHILYYACK